MWCSQPCPCPYGMQQSKAEQHSAKQPSQSRLFHRLDALVVCSLCCCCMQQQKLRKAEQRKAQQASKASSKTAASKAAEQQSIKDQAAAIAAAAFAQGSEAESDHPPELSHPQSIKEQAAAIAAAAFGQAPAQADRQVAALCPQKMPSNSCCLSLVHLSSYYVGGVDCPPTPAVSPKHTYQATL